MKKVLICTLFSCLFNHQALYSVEKTENDSLPKSTYYVYSTTAHSGFLLPTWSFVRGKFNTDGPEFCQFNDISFQMLKQTVGKLPIEQIFHYPRYGFGIYTGEFFKGNYFSRPWGAFGIFIGSFADWQRLSLNYSMLIGATGNWNHYDPAHNNFNTTLANDFTTHVDFGLRLTYEVSRHFEAGLGCSFAHFSNGAMEIPNFGINMLSPQVSLTYLPHYTKDKRIKRDLPHYLQNTFLDLAIYGGEKNLPYPECDLDTAHDFSDSITPNTASRLC